MVEVKESNVKAREGKTHSNAERERERERRERERGEREEREIFSYREIGRE